MDNNMENNEVNQGSTQAKLENKGPVKICKYCQSEIPKKAKVCPVCRKKQGGKLGTFLLAFVIVVIIGCVMTSIGEDSSSKSTKKVGTVNDSSVDSSSDNNSDDSNSGSDSSSTDDTDVVTNEYQVGDIIDMSGVKVTYLKGEKYTSDNEFIQPKDGYEYYRIELEFENGSDSDFSESVYSFNGYADDYQVDAAYFDDDLSVELSPGKKGKGSVYFEVPKDAKSFKVEYETNIWTEEKIVFVVK